MQEIFEEIKSEMVKGAIIWMPMLATDNLTAAHGREKLFTVSRIRHYWDQERILGRLLAKTLNLKASVAWDVYLTYPPHHTWDAVLPPEPIFWMHQLEEDPTRYLDPLRLKHNVQMMIEKSF